MYTAQGFAHTLRAKLGAFFFHGFEDFRKLATNPACFIKKEKCAAKRGLSSQPQKFSFEKGLLFLSFALFFEIGGKTNFSEVVFKQKLWFNAFQKKYPFTNMIKNPRKGLK